MLIIIWKLLFGSGKCGLVQTIYYKSITDHSQDRPQQHSTQDKFCGLTVEWEKSDFIGVVESKFFQFLVRANALPSTSPELLILSKHISFLVK